MSLGNAEVRDRFSTLTTPLVADACMRLGFAMRCPPPEMLTSHDRLGIFFGPLLR